MIINALEGLRLPVYGSGANVRDWLYVEDHARALIATELGWEPQETFESGLRKTIEWYLANRAWWERIRSGVYRGERLGVVA
jgi:dTDP-D-glucose 4,6-dehydratase